MSSFHSEETVVSMSWVRQDVAEAGPCTLAHNTPLLSATDIGRGRNMDTALGQ